MAGEALGSILGSVLGDLVEGRVATNHEEALGVLAKGLCLVNASVDVESAVVDELLRGEEL